MQSVLNITFQSAVSVSLIRTKPVIITQIFYTFIHHNVYR